MTSGVSSTFVQILPWLSVLGIDESDWLTATEYAHGRCRSIQHRDTQEKTRDTTDEKKNRGIQTVEWMTTRSSLFLRSHIFSEVAARVLLPLNGAYADVLRLTRLCCDTCAPTAVDWVRLASTCGRPEAMGQHFLSRAFLRQPFGRMVCERSVHWHRRSGGARGQRWASLLPVLRAPRS